MKPMHNAQPVVHLAIGSVRYFDNADGMEITAVPRNIPNPKHHFIGMRMIGWKRPDADNDKKYIQ
jgi:hypothetical protein